MSVATTLKAQLQGSVEDDPDVLAAYASDQTALATHGTPVALVRAKHADDVVATLRFAYRHQIPVVTRGAGTGLAGSANAVDGAIVLSVAALNRILTIDTVSRLAVVEPGVINGALAAAVKRQGLYYAPDPASREISTIGGNIATNAGGACCLKYGVTGDHVLALKAVLPDGTQIVTGSKSRKDVAGLDLKRLLVGSEGTLAVIVEATLRLRSLPPPPATLVAFFPTLDTAARAIVAMENAADLSLLEMMDRVTIQAVEALTALGLDTHAAAMVLVQSDAANAAAVIQSCEAIANQHAATEVYWTADPDEGRQFLTARSAALPALEKMGTTLLDDVAVPKSRLVDMFARCEAAASRHQVVIGTFGHAGDGNLHPTIVFDPADQQSRHRAYAAFDEIVKAAVEFGGSISGEHGVGNLKLGYLSHMIGDPERELMRRIKTCFDPTGILNPGKAY